MINVNTFGSADDQHESEIPKMMLADFPDINPKHAFVCQYQFFVSMKE